MEKRIRFQSEACEIEGLLEIGGEKIGAVVTHPHSLYGGEMHNSVVESVVRVFRKQGYATLRFNFRGVGRSGGTFDNGVGEQKDVMAAISFLRGNGVETVVLAGYSFGAWVNAGVSCEDIDKMIMVSPPAAFLEFPPGLKIPCLDLVVTGSRDEFGPPQIVEPLVRQWNPDAGFQIISGADHFYGGHMDRLEAVLTKSFGH